MDKSCIRNKMFADTNESGYVWTGPYSTDVPTERRLKHRILFISFQVVKDPVFLCGFDCT